jgi:hypothetical protein
MADPYVPFGYMPPTLAGNPALPFPTPEGLLPDVSPQTPGALQRLHGLGLGFFAPFSPVPPPMRTTRMVPTLGGERELPVTQVTNFGSGDPEAEAAGRMLGTGPAMRGVGMALESAPAQWLASQLARPAVGAPAATAGTVAATTAETQQPAGMTAAQRQARIEALNKDIARREKILEGFATRNFQSTVARQEASKPHQDAITAARDEIKSIRSGQEAEAARAAQEVKDRERALSGWTQTYPWLVPASGAAGFGLGSWLSNALARAGVRRFNTRTAELDQRWGEAVGRAGNR